MDLSTRYLGLELPTPVVASSSPLTRRLDMLQRMERAGAGAVVLPSLFEEQLEHDAEALYSLMTTNAESVSEAEDGFFFDIGEVDTGLREYLDLIYSARKELTIPVIASLNGVSTSGWTEHARSLADAGASALELNVFQVPTDVGQSGRDIEASYFEILRSVKEAVSIPVAMKLSPFFSSFGHFALELVDAGADGLVLFNRFYQPDIDVNTREAAPTLELSTSSEVRLPLLWLGVLAGKTRGASLAATSGVHEPADVVKYLLAGADVTMTTSALLRHGPEHIERLVGGLEAWLLDHDCRSLDQVRGSMRQGSVTNPGAYERANYMQILLSYDRN